MHSAIYQGWVRHRRRRPSPHQFKYRLFMMYLDLDELPELFRKSWFWSYQKHNLASFHRKDYLGQPQQDLKQAVLDCAELQTGHRPNGPVRLLTHMRYFGFCFNPVSFYYLFNQDEQLETIVAEITNTPWKQRHAYALRLKQPGQKKPCFEFEKGFHVSPFMPMDMNYRWRFTHPQQKLLVHMDLLKQTENIFDATTVMQKLPMTKGNLRRMLFKFPFLCTAILLRIHIQALKLWFKKNPVYDHPEKHPTKL